MSRLPLTPEQAELAERIYQTPSARPPTPTSAASPNCSPPSPTASSSGQTEFEVRDRVHKIGAKAFETALDERKKGGTKGPA